MAYTNLPLNLQDIVYSITDRVSKLETGPNSAQTSADSAQSTANAAYTQAVTAQAQATQALAQATIAYNQAVSSLKPSASVIANASQQITSISGSGVTIYSGASSSSGARVILNSVGLAGYDASNNATFSISASTGAAVFSGNVTGATITGGTLNIAGNAIINSSGYLTATGATITGSITATSGSFTGSLYSTSGTIGGWSIGSTQFVSGATYLDSSAGTIQTSGLISSLANMTANGSITAGTSLGGNSLSIATTAGISGNLTASSLFFNSGHTTTTSAANAYLNSSTGLLARSTSSQRYKIEIQEQAIPIDSILALNPKSYVDKGEAEEKGSTDGLQRLLGLIAEDVIKIPVIGSMLANLNEQGQPDSVNYDRVAIALIPFLKDLNNRVNKLEGK
jgi:hypothetical protein